MSEKHTHINGCKIVHKCIIAIVTVHIYSVTTVYAFNILIISDSLIFFLSLFFVCKTNPPSHVLSSSDTHTSTNKKSKINYKNPKSTTKSTKKNQPLEQNCWIGDRWSWIMNWRCDLDRWCELVLMEIDDGLMWIGVDGDR